MAHALRAEATRVRQRLSLKGLLAVVVWGMSFVATRLVLQALDPYWLVAARLLLGAGLLAAIVRARGGRPWPLRRDWPVGIFMGVVIATHLLLQARGLLDTTAIHAGWIIGFIPVCIAVGAQLLGQQRLAPLGWLGVILGTGGVLLVTAAEPPDFARARFGDLLQIASCLTWTVYTLAGARATARNGPLRMTAFAMGVAAVLVLIAAVGLGGLRGPVTPATLGSLAFLGVVCSGVAYYCWFSATHEQGPTRVAALLYLEPFVTLGAAIVVLREPWTLHAVFGGLVVLVGVWLVAHGARRGPPTPDAG